jgi:hypothetical protein
MSDAAVLRDAVARIVRALQALHDGELFVATKILEDLERELREPDFRRPHRCPNCGVAFRWVGELDHHLRFGSCSTQRGRAAAS